ncbi:rhomboid family intramembrane serine protease [Primorskyibacter sp. S187A]|uniref:rhomboid family intramembrane serine protease n=1 Tax=Primorskyibacter sp. S187A TaxID=3415130 RepID=UPI003C7C77A5
MFPIRDHNPSGRIPYVTYALIGINVVVFLSYVGLFQNDRALVAFFFDYAFIPARFSEGEGILGLFTSMFLHGGWAHLLGNMLFLWIFGDNIEDELGHGPFLGFYIAGGVAAAMAQYLGEPGSPVPMVGASGAIAAVMGAYLLMYPKAKVDILIILVIIFRIIPIPAWIMLGLWFAMQLIGGVGSIAGTGGVAYWAHAGGFIAGIILIFPLWTKRGGPAFWRSTDGHPPHPEARYPFVPSSIPNAGRRR